MVQIDKSVFVLLTSLLKSAKVHSSKQEEQICSTCFLHLHTAITIITAKGVIAVCAAFERVLIA